MPLHDRWPSCVYVYEVPISAAGLKIARDASSFTPFLPAWRCLFLNIFLFVREMSQMESALTRQF